MDEPDALVVVSIRYPFESSYRLWRKNCSTGLLQYRRLNGETNRGSAKRLLIWSQVLDSSFGLGPPY